MTIATQEIVYFLLVDDLEENLLALEALLRREGVTILKARSGDEALELLLQYDVALSLIDVQMPVMDGFELAELMRGTDRTRRVPIIFVTAGSADRQRRFRGYEAGAVDFLQKPIEPDVLRSKTEVFFDLCRQRQDIARQRDVLKAATTENARLLEQSRRQAEALRQADHRKDEFLAMLAHELRNPLAPIRNAVEILRLHQTSDPAVEGAREIISRQVGHMARLIDDLLDVARIVSGKVQLRVKRTDFAEIVRQTAEDYRPTLASAGLTLDVGVPSEEIPLLGDAIRLAQVIGNLLHNASKFTPAGGKVRVQVHCDHANRCAIFSVEDTGAGLDMGNIGQLFEPFSQASPTLGREKGGLGLGLALAKGLVELHQGSISAESAGAGKGSVFTIRLPLIESSPTQPVASRPPTKGTACRRLKILVIEDNADSAKSLKLLLSLSGHEVEVALDGSSGVKAARSFSPDVVLSDLGLPGAIDGYSVAKQLRNDPSLASIRLIALSGYGHDEDRRRAHDAGFDQHLVKPVGLQQLKEAIASTAV